MGGAAFIEGVATDESYELGVDELLARAAASDAAATAPPALTASEAGAQRRRERFAHRAAPDDPARLDRVDVDGAGDLDRSCWVIVSRSPPAEVNAAYSTADHGTSRGSSVRKLTQEPRCPDADGHPHQPAGAALLRPGRLAVPRRRAARRYRRAEGRAWRVADRPKDPAL